MIKIPDKDNLEKKMFILIHSFRGLVDGRPKVRQNIVAGRQGRRVLLC